ncbi:MAG: FAD-dependent thymidylate synthase [Patescibacteria group bacterium]
MIGKANILATTCGYTDSRLLELIEAAGRTCYKSDKRITPGSAVTFVKSILLSGHESVIEHSWLAFLLQDIHAQAMIDLLLANHLLVITRHLGANNYLVSGNARMFRDLFKRRAGHYYYFEREMIDQLAEIAPILFEEFAVDYTPANPLGDRTSAILSPKIDYSRDEKLAHWWAMARITGCSRAFTHQQVRHRERVAYSQESQRYCDEGGFVDDDYFVTPPSIIEAGLAGNYRRRMKLIDRWYQWYRTKVKKEDARFFLPNAVCSEIVISTNLAEWRWIFRMRCDHHAQWEIRAMMMSLLKEFQQLFPGCFDDFVISADGQSANLQS